jgi:peptidoglycan lytic transglycosylase D
MFTGFGMGIAHWLIIRDRDMKVFVKLLAISLLWVWSLFPSEVKAQEGLVGESSFPVLQGLEKSVEFWKQVFTVYDTSQLIFFDPVEPTTIYSVVEVKDERSLGSLIREEKSKIIGMHGVEEERIRTQRGIKNRFAEGLVRSGRYIEQMQQIFRAEGLPAELTYLPLVESSFNIHARSSAGAVGMWQFMRSTGRRFLRIDRHLDERRDPLESTRAAALFLKENYEALGNWPLAITAYNHGAEGVSRAVARVGSQDLTELIRNYESRTWGFASTNFYAEFLAAVEVAKNVERYFPGLESEAPGPVEEVELQKATPITALLKSTGIPRKQFLEWNPALHPAIAIVPQGYRVKVSAKKLEPTLAARNDAPDGALIRHRVKRGETLFQIARHYEASVEDIQQLNGLRKTHRINIGQELLIPTQ